MLSGFDIEGIESRRATEVETNILGTPLPRQIVARTP
jgi:hypothetical protein